MTNANETAYPRLKGHPTEKDLAIIYSPSPDELDLARQHAKAPVPRIGFLVMLKTFQRLGYFVLVGTVPKEIILHISRAYGFKSVPKPLINYDSTSARYRHMDIIRQHLGVTACSDDTYEALARACTEAATTKEDIADIINVAIEELVRQRYELPGFSTFLKAAKKARITVNVGYHRAIYQALGKTGRTKIDALLAQGSRNIKSPWDMVKQEPQHPTVGHMREFTAHLRWLQEFSIDEEAFALIPDVKIRQFAAEAKALDATSMRDLAEKKRYAIAAILIRLQTARALDDLAEMFVKRMQKMHRLGKEALERYHIRNIDQTQNLVAMLRKVVIAAFKSDDPSEKRLDAITSAVGTDPDKILEQCEAFGAHAGGNYLAFLPRIFKGIRSALFSLLEAMPLITTSSDKSVLLAVSFLLQNRSAKSEWLHNTAALDLSWVADKWWPLVAGSGIKPGTKLQQVSRRYFEICLFTQVMQELKSGDLAICGGDKFSDYRHQLLSWEDFEKERAVYGEQVGLPVDGKAFVTQMREKLTAAADEANQSFPDNEAVRLENGEPVIAGDGKDS